MSISLIVPLVSLVYLGSGRNRDVYAHGDYVIKVPANSAGQEDNWYEAESWIRRQGSVPLARCRLMRNGWLIMERVKVAPDAPYYSSDYQSWLRSIPEWADFVDCRQVGLNRKSQWVAYDYGLF